MLSVFAPLILAAAAAATTPPTGANAPIDVAASNWAFTPKTIVLHVNQPATLRFTSNEGVHGIGSDDLGIPKTTLTPGRTVTIQVTPKKAGVYKLPCTIICGAGHAAMVLTVDVEP